MTRRWKDLDTGLNLSGSEDDGLGVCGDNLLSDFEFVLSTHLDFN